MRTHYTCLFLVFMACGDDGGGPSGDATSPDVAPTGDTASTSDTTAAATTDGGATTTGADTSTATSVPDGATAATDTTLASDTTSGCAGGSIVFTWGAGPTIVTETVAPIEIAPLGTDTRIALACPDDWFDVDIAALADVPVAVLWQQTRVADDPWDAYAASFAASASVYDFIYVDHGPRHHGTFTVTSSTGDALTYAVKHLEPGSSESVDATHRVITFRANLSRDAGPYATLEGVGQDLRIERLRVKYDATGTWTPWVGGDDAWDPAWVPQGAGASRAAEVEIINTCWPTGYAYHYPSTPLADWEGPQAEAKSGWIVFEDNRGLERNGINVFDMVPTAMLPAWEQCDVDYTFRFRVGKVENR